MIYSNRFKHHGALQRQIFHRWASYVLAQVFLLQLIVLHVVVKKLGELLVNIVENDLPIHDPPTDHYHLWGKQQSHIVAQLGQVIADELPDLLGILQVLNFSLIDIVALADSVVSNVPLKTVRVIGAD